MFWLTISNTFNCQGETVTCLNPTNKPVPRIPTPNRSLNELLMKKSMLRPIPPRTGDSECKRTVARTPFDYWLHHNELNLIHKVTKEKDKGDKCSTDEWNSLTSKRTSVNKTSKYLQNLNKFAEAEELNHLKYYDEDFMEIYPDFISLKSYSNPEILLSNGSIDPVRSFDRSTSKCTVLHPKHKHMKYANSNSGSVLCRSMNFEKQSQTPQCNLKIRFFNQDSYNCQLSQSLQYNVKRNSFTVFPKTASHINGNHHIVPKCLRSGKYPVGWSFANGNRNICHTHNLAFLNVRQFKFLFTSNMSDSNRKVPAEQVYNRIVKWVKTSDFKSPDSGSSESVVPEIETNILEGHSDITSITKRMENKEKLKQYNSIVINNDIKVVKAILEEKSPTPSNSFDKLKPAVETFKGDDKLNSLKKHSSFSPWQIYTDRIKSNIKTPGKFPIILEGSESVCLPLPMLVFTTAFLFYMFVVIYNYELTVLLFFCPY